MASYDEFLAAKAISDPHTGIDNPGDMRSDFKPHQADICRWALRRGRAAVFAGTGLGKTLIELEWADKVVVFRKPGDNAEPVSGGFDRYIGDPKDEPDRSKYTMPMDARNWYSIEVWQRYASPVWTDIRQSRTLQYRAARDEKDEQHISPLQLDVIERCIDLWSNPGDTVLTPFMGIGSEVYCAVEMNRFGIGFELKPTYYAQAVRNIAAASQFAADDLMTGADE